MKSKHNFLGFFETIGKLKALQRTGWIERGVKNPESVAEHSFRMSAMALILGPKLKCNVDRLLKLCIVHDLHESICGDLILDYSRYDSSFKGLTREEKKKREVDAFEKLKAILGPDAKEFSELWQEYENQETREAELARELDLLEMLVQCYEYEKAKNYKKPLWAIWISENDAKIKHPELKKILEKIKEKINE